MNNYYNPYYPSADCKYRSQPQDNCPNAAKMTPFPEEYSLAMAYVPFQTSAEVYDAEKGFCRGTLFPALDKPFVGC